MYAQLGNIVFEGLRGFTAFGSRKSSSIAQHAVIDGKPKLQKTGEMLDEINFDMTFHASFCTPETEINKLESALSNGEIMPLITGAGESLGSFVITDLAQSTQHTDKTGRIILARVSVSLLESAETDTLSQAVSAAKGAAFANAANTPNTVPFTEIRGASLKATSSLTDAVGLQVAGTTNLTLAASSTGLRANELRKAQNAFEGVTKSVETFEDAFSTVQSSIANAEQIKSAASTAKTYAETVVTAIKAGDVNAAVSANRDLRNGLGDLKFQSSTLVTLVATRRI